MGIIKGKSIFPGMVMSSPYLENKKKLVIPETKIKENEINLEIERFKVAVQKSKEDIKLIYSKLKGKISLADLQILEVQLLLLDDPQFIDNIKITIKDEKYNAEFSVKKITEKYVSMFEQIEDNLYKQRALDIKDIGDRVIGNLLSDEIIDTQLDGKILVTKELFPSTLLKIYYSGIKLSGIIMEYNGETSHTAILAKTLEIPTLMGGYDIFSINWGKKIILDTTKQDGVVLTNPDENIIIDFYNLKEKYEKKIEEIEKNINEKSITLDGHKIDILINVGDNINVEQIKYKNPEGIGLLRTEFLYMNATSLPDEEEQYSAYLKIAKKFDEIKKNSPITIRTLDIGADKKLSYYEMPNEENPSLGCRGLRLTLENKDIFKSQIKAILRVAAEYSNIKMMYPMVTSINEIREANEIVEECKNELLAEEKKFKKNIEIGMMIEVPTNILLADVFIQYVDFFSIGTNDLTQYILATDRYSSVAEKLYDSYNPSVMRAIYSVTKVAVEKNKPISICGEMGGEELAVIALLSFGVRIFSMTSAYVPKIRALIRKIKISELNSIKIDLMKAENSDDVKLILNEYLNKLEAGY